MLATAAGGGGRQRQLLRDALVADSQGHHRYVDGRAGFGLAPLHLAAFSGHLAATKSLLRWGASLAGEPRRRQLALGSLAPSPTHRTHAHALLHHPTLPAPLPQCAAMWP